MAAIRAAQLGMKVACVEKRATLGGTCLNVGCIPSKALLQSSHLFEEAAHDLAEHGILVDAVEARSRPACMQRKGEVVDATTKGVDFLFRKNKITSLQGTGRIDKAGAVVGAGRRRRGQGHARRQEHPHRHRLGSDAAAGREVDEKKIVSSTGALELAEVPEHLVVIGGGIIGLELGSVWRRLGAEVTVIEFLDRIVPGVDDEIAKALPAHPRASRA